MAIVATQAVDLRLKFAVTGPKKLKSFNPFNVDKTLDDRGATAAAAKAALGQTYGDVTIEGYPTVSCEFDQITIDLGLVCSERIQTSTTSPPVSRFEVTIAIPGHDAITASFFILRPPVVGMGAFTIPALPMAIVYAPPQGQQCKNIATYSDTETISRTVTSSITNTTSTKSVQAYSVGDLIAKVTGAIAAVAAVVGTGGAAAGAGASVAGAMSELGNALFGQAKSANDSAAAATKQISGELAAVQTLLAGFQTSQSTTDTGVTTNETDQSLTLSVAQLSQHSSAPGLGPGLGDRIVYLTDVKVVWAAVNGEVGIVVLGYLGTGANAVSDLLVERDRLAKGSAARLGLSAATVESLLAQDPMASKQSIVDVVLGRPVIGPPRFVPTEPGERRGTSAQGDTFQTTAETITEYKSTLMASETHVEDTKPGWLGVVFGADDVETMETSILTMTHTSDIKIDKKATSTVTYFSLGPDDPYEALSFIDRMFGTVAYLPPKSPLLQGKPVVSVRTGHQDDVLRVE